MQLSKVTFTGLDDHTDLSQVDEFCHDNPLAEIGVLYSPSWVGTGRYPSVAKIYEFVEKYPHVPKALHICGAGFMEFMDATPHGWMLATKFDRVQLNMNWDKRKGKTPLGGFVEAVRALKRPVIVQYTRGNKELVDAIAPSENVQALFDGSGGRGKLPDFWPAPLPGRACGYAGGLAPGNIFSELQRIDKAAGDAAVWVDMESGVRTDDKFDLEKCRNVMFDVVTWLMKDVGK